MKNFLLSYHNRNKLLIAGIVIFLLITYDLAIKPTITLYSSSNLIKAKISEYLMERQKIIEYGKEIDYLDQNMGLDKKIDSNTEQNLLELISLYCKDGSVLLKEFPKTIKYKNQNYLIENHIIKLQGGFIDILKFVYQLEQVNKIGKIISLQFQSIKDLNTQNLYLVSTIYVQKIKVINNENQ